MRIFAYILLILSLNPSYSHASDPFAMAYDIHTKESIVDVSGKKYRKVEYKGDVFYLRLLEAEASASEIEFACGSASTTKMENQILISTAVTKRSSLFIEGLRQTCKDVRHGGGQVTIDPNIQIGFVLNDSKSALIKNKKIYWSPASRMLGVGGEW